jgi:hypothetical protein
MVGRGAGPGLVGLLSAVPRGRQEREEEDLGQIWLGEKEMEFFTLFSIFCFQNFCTILNSLRVQNQFRNYKSIYGTSITLGGAPCILF